MTLIKTRGRSFYQSRMDRSSGEECDDDDNEAQRRRRSRARPSERERRMLGWPPKMAERMRLGARDKMELSNSGMQGPSMRMCEVAMMRVFIDKMCSHGGRYCEGEEKRAEPSRACQRDRATSWVGSIVTGLPTCTPSLSISSNMVAGSGSQMRTVPSSPQVANITAVGHQTAELTPFF